MTFDPGRPFNDLPNLPPASETETKAILRSCIAARTALAELRVSGKLIPNPETTLKYTHLADKTVMDAAETVGAALDA